MPGVTQLWFVSFLNFHVKVIIWTSCRQFSLFCAPHQKKKKKTHRMQVYIFFLEVPYIILHLLSCKYMTAYAHLRITYFSSMCSEGHWVLNGALLCVRSVLLTSVSKKKKEKTHKEPGDTGQRLSSHNVSNHAQKHAPPLATLPLTRLHSAFDRPNDGNGWQRDRQRGSGRKRAREQGEEDKDQL